MLFLTPTGFDRSSTVLFPARNWDTGKTHVYDLLFHLIQTCDDATIAISFIRIAAD